MAEFTDTANAVDNTGFSDSLGDATTSTPQGIPDSTATANTGDSSPTPPDATGTDTVTIGDTATPTDSTQDSTGDAVPNTPEEQDTYTLLQQLQTQQQEYQTQVLETAQTLTEQAKNTLSCLVLTIVLIGFLSGLVLARSVWRKF
jgi:hypothetical protein